MKINYIMKKIKALLFISLIALYFISCNTSSGYEHELTGVQNRPKWYEPEPLGMQFIPAGSFNMGQNDQDVPMAFNTQTKTVSIDAFWMDVTEITNNEYRQFVYWVRDSIAMRLCIMNSADLEQVFCYQPKTKKGQTETAAPGEEGPCFLNWANRNLLWDPKFKQADAVKEALQPLYYDEQDRLYARREFDTRRLVFEYYWIDLRQAAKYQNKYIYDDLGSTLEEVFKQGNPQNQGLPKGHYEGKIVNYDYDKFGVEEDFKNRGALVQHMKVPVYPDTLVWMRDYTYSYNEPIARKYFWHPAFDDYPVVGITWWQANAFSAWRTKIMRDWSARQGTPAFEDYRLPTEAEWEYAARGGAPLTVYPWGSPYTRNNLGCFLANFKPLRGRYGVDLANRTIKVATYEPNDYGLYDMAGNVAEWTADSYDESSYSFMHDLNPTVQYFARNDDPPVRKRKVIRGGSWKDIGFYLQCGVRAYEYQDSAKSYIGFRNVRSYLGTGIPEAYQ